MAPIKVELQQRGNDWVAYLWGRSSPILEPVALNARSRGAARWPSREAAEAALPGMLGHAIEVVRVAPVVLL